MKQLRYYLEYSTNHELFPDWKTQAMNIVEPCIIFICQNKLLEKQKDIDFDDIAQELRLQVWRKLEMFDPSKSSLKTWASTVARNKIIDMSRSKKEILDSGNRRELPTSYI